MQQLAHLLLAHVQLDVIAHALHAPCEFVLEALAELGRQVREHHVAVQVVTVQEVLDAALVADPALHDDRDAVADHLDVGQDVGIHEYRLALGSEAQNDVADLLAADRVETAHRLVEEDHLGVVHQRLGDAHPLQHALRVGAKPRVGRVLEAHPLEQLVHASCAPRRLEAGEPRVEVEYLAAGQVGVEPGVLRQEADVLAERALRHVAAQHPGLAAGRPDQPHQQLEGRRLAGAVRTDEAEDLAAAHRERQAVEHALAPHSEARAEVLDYVEDFDDVTGLSGHQTPPPAGWMTRPRRPGRRREPAARARPPSVLPWRAPSSRSGAGSGGRSRSR